MILTLSGRSSRPSYIKEVENPCCLLLEGIARSGGRHRRLEVLGDGQLLVDGAGRCMRGHRKVVGGRPDDLEARTRETTDKKRGNIAISTIDIDISSKTKS